MFQLIYYHHCHCRQTHMSVELLSGSDRPRYVPASHTMAFTPQCSPAKTHYFSNKYYRVLIATHFPDGWKAELA